MKASTMSIFDKRKPEAELFGVKIQVNNRRAVYVAKNGEKQLLCVSTKKEAQVEADSVNDFISKNPDFEAKLNSDKTIKVVLF